jgi:hypothetical protein
LDPEFWHYEQWKNSEIMDEFQVVAERILGVEQDTKALSQWISYINTECTFANANTFEQAKAMPGATFWQMHGSTLPDLQRLAMIVLSQPVSVGGVERVWSTNECFTGRKKNKFDAWEREVSNQTVAILQPVLNFTVAMQAKNYPTANHFLAGVDYRIASSAAEVPV